MDNSNPTSRLESQVRVLKIIVAASVTGVIVFMAVVIFIRSNQEGVPDEVATMPMITYIATGWAVLSVVLRGIVPNLLVTTARRQFARTGQTTMAAKLPDMGGSAPPGDIAGALAGVYVTRGIVAVALLEGAALFAIVSYMVEGQPLAVGVAIVLAVFLAFEMPTQFKAENWLDEQARKIREEKQFIG